MLPRTLARRRAWAALRTPEERLDRPDPEWSAAISSCQTSHIAVLLFPNRQLLKAGQQNSKWAQQVQTYACLYTSHVTNLALISPDTRLRVFRDMMPHELASIEETQRERGGDGGQRWALHRQRDTAARKRWIYDSAALQASYHTPCT